MRPRIVQFIIAVSFLGANVVAQGKAAPCPLFATSLQKAGQDFEIASQYIGLVRDALATFPGEAELLGEMATISRCVSWLIDPKEPHLRVASSIISRENSNLRIYAFVGSCPGSEPGVAMVIALNGPFYNPSTTVGPYRGGTALARGLIILHELCHNLATSCIDDLDDPQLADENNRFLVRNFRKTLEEVVRLSGRHRTGGPAIHGVRSGDYVKAANLVSN